MDAMKDYGNGPSTGLEQTVSGKTLTGLVPADVSMAADDRAVLRRLAERVAAIAASPKMAETRRLWTAHNRLERCRPLYFCDPENGWNEIITEAQMQCRGRLARRWEMDLRKEIFWGDVLGDDKPVEPYFDVPYTCAADDWGLAPTYHKTAASGSYVWDGAIKDYATDLKRLHAPHVQIDWETTNGCLAIAKEVFGDLLGVRLKGPWWWSLGLTHLAATFRGLQNLLCDLVENPDGLKELLSLISCGNLAKLDWLEANRLLGLNNDGSYVGSGGYGFSDQLPQPDMTDHVRPCDMWGFTESQETVYISPKMYEEFVFPYEKPIMERFGLTCYGCCEPLNGRWNTVKRHHNLRRVSCSPWADIEKMAESLGSKYVLSYKPNPAALAVPELNEESIRIGLRETLEKTKGCVVEVIMKDNHTLANRPENAVTWCRIAREEVERISA
jgi:hypothetical protein